MAKLGQIPLIDRSSGKFAGAAFLLSRRSPLSYSISFDNGAIVELRSNNNYVVARLGFIARADDALQSGHEIIQHALDHLSITGESSLTIRDSSDEYFIWWLENHQKIVLRAVSTTILNFEVFPAKAIVRDQHGNEIRSSLPILPRCHPAFRYFRLSQITDDLYDAYRNMYLAFELLLSSQYPKGNEKEIDWLNRGLTASLTPLNLTALLPPNTVDPIATIIQKIYEDARLPLFHAKEGKGFFIPQSIGHRHIVAEALQLLTNIVLRMSEAWQGVRYLGGAVYPGWVYRNMSDYLSACRMLASSDSSSFDPATVDLSHARYLEGVWMNASLAPQLSTDQSPVLLGVLNQTDFGLLNSVWRFEVVDTERPLIAHTLEDELTIEGIDRLECQLNTRVSNTRRPRSLFAR